MKKYHPLVLSLLSAFLLFASWPVSPFTFLIFFAFVPLLLLEQHCPKTRRFFVWTYLTLLLWNISTTWWICKASLPGGISAILANSFLMCIPWVGFHYMKKTMGSLFGYLSLPLFWISFEYIHLNWELSWPWLTLGNVFSTHPDWVQWYEYTGTSGGSLWVMASNLLVFQAMKKGQGLRVNLKYGLAIFLVFLIPFSLSYILLRNLRSDAIGIPKPGSFNIVVVQPNIDPWDEKFVAGKQEDQLRSLIRLSESRMDAHTRLVVWPETAIPIAIDEDSMKSSYFMAPVWDFLKRNPSINLLTGVEGFRFLTAEKKGVYAQKLPDSELYIERYNSAAMMDSTTCEIYHKSKLVPGAEVLPSFLSFLEVWFEKFGGTFGSYSSQKERTVLKSSNHSYAVASAICYESVFGEFMAQYIRRGASIIVVITNDGWWGDTPGYKQHESYDRLRAIETRHWVIRSANTGISCFIDPEGKIINPLPWDKAAAIKLSVPPNDYLTFFVKHGDILSKMILGASLILLAWNLVFIIQLRLNRGK